MKYSYVNLLGHILTQIRIIIILKIKPSEQTLCYIGRADP